jgi:KAP family P-loop domain
MKPFPDEPTFTPGERGFDGEDENGRPYDLLGRKPFGQRLTYLLDQVEQPLVVALDGDWGSGKSHFLKLWTGAHSLELGGKAKIIYFDAFEHDYLDDPLISLVARLTTKEAEATWGTKAVKAVKRAALPLAKVGLRMGAAAATAGVTEIVGPVADSIAKEAGEATQSSIDAFWRRETGRIAAMQQFRSALTALTKNGEAPQKIVFIIDELDRCRPDYALMLLETVKHFFAVPCVHFVLGANLNSLEHSVYARYGDRADAATYLQKFLHLKMQLPKYIGYDAKTSVALTYFESLFGHSGLEQRFQDDIREQVEWLLHSRDVSLRDFNRIIFECSIVAPSLSMKGNYFSILISLLLMRVLSPRTYRSFLENKLTLDEVEAYLGRGPGESDFRGQWILDFWRSTFGIDLEGRKYRDYLNDFYESDRLSYLRRYFIPILETFKPMS